MESSKTAARVGDRVRITRTTYTHSISVGATGVVTCINTHDGVYSVQLDHNEGTGWAEEVEVIQ